MKIRSVLINIIFCTICALILTSCYTVKGAVQGAGKDVSVIAGPPSNGYHHHRAVTKKSTVHKSSKNSKVTTSVQSNKTTKDQTTSSY